MFAVMLWEYFSLHILANAFGYICFYVSHLEFSAAILPGVELLQ